jgi:hypothetical protein
MLYLRKQMIYESLFQPRCCRKPIDIEDAGAFLTPDTVDTENKLEESAHARCPDLIYHP